MDVLEAIRTRRSIRKYLAIPVEWEKIGRVLEAGKQAPCSGNIQNWKFVVVLNSQNRHKIAEASLQQYWMETAPVHVVVVGESSKAKQYYGIRGERLYTIQNCSAAIENMLLAAHAMGLGACWVSAFDENMVSRALNCLDDVRPQAIITLGYPDEKPAEPAEYVLEDVVYLEKWKTGCTVVADMDSALNYQSAKVMKALDTGKGVLERIGEGTTRLGGKIADRFGRKMRELEEKKGSDKEPPAWYN
ncbi:nitroreductase family protein [Candidatus Woesearchaeota archaeon]|nr:nitroreductase family protein [Candidatus Woesearchaeota archaeon]